MRSRVLWWAINTGLFALAVVASFYLVFSAHREIWPKYWGPTVNVMSATGYSLGGPLWRSLLIALPLAFVPRFREIPGRYLLATALLLVSFSVFEAYRVHSRVEAGSSPYAVQAQ